MSKCFVLALILLVRSAGLFSQESTLYQQLVKLPELNILVKNNPNFREYYEISILQPLKHNGPSQKFKQRFFLGVQAPGAPTVMVTDGYTADYASQQEYSNELAKELHANILVVEHRFAGKSLPDSLDWSSLTLKQAAHDYHRIKQLLDTILTGNWITTGISKGGQAALAYKLYFPNDSKATVVYGTAVKNKMSVISDSLLRDKDLTPCGQNIRDIQSFAFRHKDQFLPPFKQLSIVEGLNYRFNTETVFDYILLEFPFSFWQNGHACSEMPDTTNSVPELLNYITHVSSPVFLTVDYKKRLAPSFYMFYHELGYYEFGTEQFKQWLRDSTYSNHRFAPAIPFHFDDSYQVKLHEFLKSNASSEIFFIYGENDPWAFQNGFTGNNFIIPAGSHKSRVSDLSPENRALFYQQLKSLAGIK
ncbi:MAG: hypothetical protein K0R65_1634 [Crocinitomicaceae bacterium]|jgi:pimeloyl-ACP methyl ester carboxylesterase|nr:hypothetical protein [Crocinitomicaceae bacterium]